MPHYLGNRSPPSERPVAIKTAAEVGVTERPPISGCQLRSVPSAPWDQPAAPVSSTHSKECEMDVWLVIFHERNSEKKIHDLHLRESGDWRKSCWSLVTSDGLIILELMNL